MPTLTGAKLANVTASALDYYLNTPEVYYQSIQQKPLVALMERKKKTFSGGKKDISVGIKGDFGAAGVNDSLKGFDLSDTVTFYEPENTRRAAYPWKEHHIGFNVTHSELKIDGLVVVDTDGEDTRPLSGREKHVLADILDEKSQDFMEQYARSLNALLWGDGTTDAKGLAGIRAFITDNPATGLVGGVDRASATWWRNRFNLGIVSNVADGGALLQFLQKELRQLRRYGGNPDAYFCGSDWIDALEKERRANGLYGESGASGRTDASVGDVAHGSLVPTYDPTLDDLGMSKRAYIFDSSRLFLDALQGDWKRQHTPSRPYNQFVTYRSIVSTGAVVASQLNCCGVYAIT
jgi:hypothetical protein